MQESADIATGAWMCSNMYFVRTVFEIAMTTNDTNEIIVNLPMFIVLCARVLALRMRDGMTLHQITAATSMMTGTPTFSRSEFGSLDGISAVSLTK
jgi:hypothetical protein